MPILDTEKIINGTDSKKLFHAYENLKNQYSDEMAKNYRSCYVGKPISFLISNARYIIPEAQFGLPFMMWNTLNCPITYRGLMTVKDCIKDYCNENKTRIHPNLLVKYQDACSKLEDELVRRNGEGIIENSKDIEGEKEFVDNLYSEVCNYRVECGDEEAVKMFDSYTPYKRFDDFKEYSKNCPHILKVVYLTPYAKEIGMEGELCNSYNAILDESCEGCNAKAKNLVSCESVQELALSQRFTESVSNFTNINLRCVANGLINADITSEILSAFKEAAENTINPVYTDNRSAVNAIMEESVFDEVYKEDRQQLKSELLSLKKAVYEKVLDFTMNTYEVLEETDIFPETKLFTMIKESMGVVDEITVGDALKLIVEAVSEIEVEEKSFFEATEDGSANRVIQKNHPMFRENEKKSNSSPTLEEEDATEIPKSARVASRDLPDSSNPNATNSKPKKPKNGILTNIQNKAMDIHKGSRMAAAKLRKAGTNVKNAGKAVLKIPAGLVESLKRTAKSFDEMDDNARKQYMLQPGYRKRVFKNIRVAATYGLAAHVSALLVPITWLARRLSKEKNKRLRNEFSMELETEIKVCEAKIEDANGNGDQEQKYRLIRLRDQLAREKERVATNGKYI